MNARRLLPLLLIVAMVVLAAPSTASAQRGLPRLGIADNNVSTFQDARFNALGIRTVRLTVPWNIYLRPNGRGARRFNEWLRIARQRRYRVLMSFTLGNFKSRKRRFRLAPIKSYTRMFRRFRRRHPSVREFIPWNEVNHRFMPTRTARGSRQLARYYRAVKRRCRRCTVLGATVIDTGNMARYLRRYKRILRRMRIRRPRRWGLHAYKGVARFRAGTLRSLFRTVPGQIWVVETGGMFQHLGRRPRLRADAQRQLREMRFMFRTVNGRFRRIKRVYVYNWAQTSRNNWDSALIGPDNVPRPAFATVQNQAVRRGLTTPGRLVPPLP